MIDRKYKLGVSENDHQFVDTSIERERRRISVDTEISIDTVGLDCLIQRYRTIDLIRSSYWRRNQLDTKALSETLST